MCSIGGESLSDVAIPPVTKILCSRSTRAATRAVSDPSPQDPKIGSFANFDNLGSKTPGLLAKRPSKRPEKDPKNRFTGPNFENP